ncbi:MAG: hypothetical protein WDO15_11425 [Bacteroidota bacterium]
MTNKERDDLIIRIDERQRTMLNELSELKREVSQLKSAKDRGIGAIIAVSGVCTAVGSFIGYLITIYTMK